MISYNTCETVCAFLVLFCAAYLARQGYSHTMSAFLQECTVLPSNTSMMVRNQLVRGCVAVICVQILPEVPLSRIIAEHKARTESG